MDVMPLVVVQVGLIVGLITILTVFIGLRCMPRNWCFDITEPFLWTEAFLMSVVLSVVPMAFFFISPHGFGFNLAVKIYGVSMLVWQVLPAAIAGYFLIGVVWATVHFWLYAKRLGQMYVLERAQWLTANGAASVADLSESQRQHYSEVLEKVKDAMHYDGDFPLNVWQQKRFFTGNLFFWPVTLFVYVLLDGLRDLALRIAYALRDTLHQWWSHKMSSYDRDEAQGAALRKLSSQGGSCAGQLSCKQSMA